MPKTRLGTGNDVIALAMKSDELEFFIEWLAIPASERPPELSSQKKVADHLDVSEQSLRNWKRDPRVQSKVSQIRTSRLQVEDLPNVYATLYLQATDPQNPRSVAASKLLIEEAHRLFDQQSNVTQELKGKTIAELKEIAAGLWDEFDEREHTGDSKSA